MGISINDKRAVVKQFLKRFKTVGVQELKEVGMAALQYKKIRKGAAFMYEIGICDDIQEICDEVYQRITAYFSRFNIDLKIYIFQTGQALLHSDVVFDMLFLDIELERENGLEIAALYPYKKETRIIFLTSHIEEMPNGYKVRAFRFLTKPIDTKHFEEALTSAVQDIERDKRFAVVDELGEHIIRASEIYYLESQQRSTGVRTKDRFSRCGLSIEEMKQELDQMQFYCPHKSYIVNMDYIQTFDKDVVIMKNGEKVKVSRLKMKDFKERFYDYLRSRANGY